MLNISNSKKPLTNKVYFGSPSEKTQKGTIYPEKVDIGNKPIEKPKYSIHPPYSYTLDVLKEYETYNEPSEIREDTSGLLTITHTPLPEIRDTTDWTFNFSEQRFLRFISLQLWYEAYNNFVVGSMPYVRIELRIRRATSGIYLLTIPLIISKALDCNSLHIPCYDLLLDSDTVVTLDTRSFTRTGAGANNVWTTKASIFTKIKKPL